MPQNLPKLIKDRQVSIMGLKFKIKSHEFSIIGRMVLLGLSQDLWPPPPVKYRKLRKPTEKTRKTKTEKSEKNGKTKTEKTEKTY